MGLTLPPLNDVQFLVMEGMMQRWEDERKAGGRSTENPNIVMHLAASYSTKMAAELLMIQPKYVSWDADLRAIQLEVDENTIGICLAVGHTLQDLHDIATFVGSYYKVDHTPIYLEAVDGSTLFMPKATAAMLPSQLEGDNYHAILRRMEQKQSMSFKDAVSCCDPEKLGFTSGLWSYFREYQLLAEAALSSASGTYKLEQIFGPDYDLLKTIIEYIEGHLQELGRDSKTEVPYQHFWHPISCTEPNTPPGLFESLVSCVQARRTKEHFTQITPKPEKESTIKTLLEYYAGDVKVFEEILEDVVLKNFQITGCPPDDSPDMVFRNLYTGPIDDLIKLFPIRKDPPQNGFPEAEIGEYPMKRVDPTDLELTRGICELILYFLTPQGIKKKRATGFFIDSETIATSGHCLYAPDFGHAIAVEAVLGSDEATGGVESRRGQCVVVHWEWFKTYSERYDLAFIRTHRFETAKPIPWMETPFAAKDMQIAVVGIPGRRANPDRHMFQSECPTTIDLPRTAFILEYRLDTLGGNSGSPVLILDVDWKLKIIGVHGGCGAGKGADNLGKLVNKAVIIDSKGNSFKAFLQTLDIATERVTKDTSISMVGWMMSKVGVLVRYGSI